MNKLVDVRTVLHFAILRMPFKRTEKCAAKAFAFGYTR